MDPQSKVTRDGIATMGGRYKMGPLLGRGATAEVYQGQDIRLGRTVAVKLLRPEIAAQAQFRDRFEAEARSAATLSHPNVVAIYDTGEQDGQPFIVMECLPGPTVADRIARGPMAQGEVAAMAVAVLAGLQAAHEAGLVHRDVKPGNILITSQGSWKVCDFGIAKALDALDPGLTTTGLLVGTPAYLAPERLAGEPATPASDIYSLGAVLYEALSATKPFASVSTLGLIAEIHANAPVLLRDLRPDVSPEMAEGIARAMAGRPADRYPSAAAMSEAFALIASTLRNGDARQNDPTEVIVDPSEGAGADDPAGSFRHAETVALASAQGPTRTIETDRGASPARLALPRRGDRLLRRLLLPLAVLAVLIVVVVVALNGGSGAPRQNGSVTTTTVGRTTASTTALSPALSNALSQLANEVSP